MLTKFMNCLMYEGKKSVAEGIVYGAFDRIAKRSGQDPLRGVPRRAGQCAARRSRCARAASAAPPIRCRSRCAPTAARRWPSAGSSSGSRDRSENTMEERLSGELLDAANNRGTA